MNPQPFALILSSVDTWIFSAFLAAFFPVAGYMLFRRLNAAGKDSPGSGKLRIYAYIIFFEWAFVTVLLLLASRHGLSISDLGETIGDPTLTIVVTVGLVVVLGLLTFVNIRQIRRTPLEKLESGIGRLRLFLPEHRSEIGVFVIVSFTAGVCEELLYRGWLQNLIAAGTGSVWIGLVLGAIVFGCGHAYQGKAGMIQTGILGLVFGGVLLLTKSLIAGQILHVTIDIVNGIAGSYAISLLKAQPGIKRAGTNTAD